jgi:hypothetical protein
MANGRSSDSWRGPVAREIIEIHLPGFETATPAKKALAKHGPDATVPEPSSENGEPRPMSRGFRFESQASYGAMLPRCGACPGRGRTIEGLLSEAKWKDICSMRAFRILTRKDMNVQVDALSQLFRCRGTRSFADRPLLLFRPPGCLPEYISGDRCQYG